MKQQKRKFQTYLDADSPQYVAYDKGFKNHLLSIKNKQLKY